MADTFSPEERSEIMKKVRSKGNKSTELSLISIFKFHSIKGWRRNYKLIGNPDFVIPKFKIAIFADGCFWHGHNCRNTKPSDNAKYWQKKIKKNRKRDRIVTSTLKDKYWIVIRIWECEISKGAKKKINLIKKYMRCRK